MEEELRGAEAERRLAQQQAEQAKRDELARAEAAGRAQEFRKWEAEERERMRREQLATSKREEVPVPPASPSGQAALDDEQRRLEQDLQRAELERHLKGPTRQRQIVVEEREKPKATPMPDFPWPPPRASAWAVIPNELLVNAGQTEPTLGVISDRLEHALDAASYHQRTFFKVPNGFAMVTQIERLKQDGTPDVERRWVPIDTAPVFSLENYIKRLLYAERGRYRLVTFVVTDMSFPTSDQTLTAKRASDLARRGALVLQAEEASQTYTPQFHTTALIYEFVKTNRPEAQFVNPSSLPGWNHLEKAKIVAALKNLPKAQ
jgi:hypothetical protein